MPVPLKYSDLARKLMCRGADSGITTLSTKDRWLLARITGPDSGMWERPVILGR